MQKIKQWSASVSESLDTFSEGHNLALSSDKEAMYSGLGALCSAVIFSTVLLFTYMKAGILLSNRDMNLLVFEIDDYFDDSETF